MNEEMRVEAMELCVTACEKFAANNEVKIWKKFTLNNHMHGSRGTAKSLERERDDIL